jgi:hypothetical protein
MFFDLGFANLLEIGYLSYMKLMDVLVDVIIAEMESPKQIINSLPEGLKKRIFGLWNIKQNPQWHPEGNTLKHVLTVLKRAMVKFPDNKNIFLAALFHDIGKDETHAINPKTNQPTAYGHDDVSARLVMDNAEWISSLGGNVEIVHFIVKNHMKMHKFDEMRSVKQQALMDSPYFQDLKDFETLDKGGLDL